MLNSASIRDIIQDVVIGFDTSSLKDDQKFKEAGIDSLDHLNILIAIEEGQSVRIPDEDVKYCMSIADILAYLASKK